MNPRHSAALVLLVWYLLVPPEDARYPNKPAPLSRWTRSGNFQSAEKCDEHLESQLDRHDVKFIGATCIASDDPRLKSK
jgi:hypothetical protein